MYFTILGDTSGLDGGFQMNDRIQWHSITGMPDGALAWGSLDYQARVAEWQQHRHQLEDPALDKTIMELWSRENRRLFAVENGQIENLYLFRREITEELITHGLEGARISHTVASEVTDDKTLSGLLTDQESALEMVFEIVKQVRPLSHSVICEWHALLTRHQESAVGISYGKRVRIPLRKGAYKIRPNNPRRPDGLIHEYCPPEHVHSEMDRLLAMYEDIRATGYPTEVEAAWLHHRYISIHPFQDGNGRTARLLMAYVYIQRGEFPPVVPASNKPVYIAQLEEADKGDLQPFAQYLSGLAIIALGAGIIAARNTIAQETYFRHSNGDGSLKPGNGNWQHIRKDKRDDKGPC